MNDSNVPEGLEGERERRRAQRIEQVKRWAEYVESTPPDVWGRQLNTVVDAQLEAARESELTVQEHQRISRACTDRKTEGDDIREQTDSS